VRPDFAFRFPVALFRRFFALPISTKDTPMTTRSSRYGLAAAGLLLCLSVAACGGGGGGNGGLPVLPPGAGGGTPPQPEQPAAPVLKCAP
jgi:hypothetical protein